MYVKVPNPFKCKAQSVITLDERTMWQMSLLYVK